LSISRERFIQILFKDPQLHHRMLQLMVRRLRQANVRLQMRSAPPAVKLAHTLVNLAESYGQKSNKGKEIFNIPIRDLADVTEIGVEEATKIIQKLQEKAWIETDSTNNALYLVNFKQLMNLADKV
ncbi:MAG: Crp/Fnr family transcriptional regulator, partial [Calothrix sp. SM1_7_51]|nr:Crp/Fnr family transcriptional regulator [Calothrix sp. SM1_7_51]